MLLLVTTIMDLGMLLDHSLLKNSEQVPYYITWSVTSHLQQRIEYCFS